MFFSRNKQTGKVHSCLKFTEKCSFEELKDFFKTDKISWDGESLYFPIELAGNPLPDKMDLVPTAGGKYTVSLGEYLVKVDGKIQTLIESYFKEFYSGVEDVVTKEDADAIVSSLKDSEFSKDLKESLDDLHKNLTAKARMYSDEKFQQLVGNLLEEVKENFTVGSKAVLKAAMEFLEEDWYEGSCVDFRPFAPEKTDEELLYNFVGAKISLFSYLTGYINGAGKQRRLDEALLRKSCVLNEEEDNEEVLS